MSIRPLLAVLLLIPSLASAQTDIARINLAIDQAGLEWRAAENSITRLSEAELRRLVLPRGALPGWVGRGTVYQAKGEAVLRDRLLSSMDWRDYKGFDWDTGIRNQGDCGSCWAFATIANIELLMNWRLSEPIDRDLSEQQLLSCAMASLGCASGGVTWLTTGTFLTGTGVTTEACYPYTSGETGDKGDCTEVGDLTAECQQAVVKMDDLIEIHETEPGSVWEWLDPPEFFMSAEAADIIKGYLEERPVGCSMRVFDDFVAYDSGIYEPTPGAEDLGLHAVQIVGFDDGGGYWIVKNSWGPDWGEGGYFRIRYNTSSFGMFAFVYEYNEDLADPVYCGDLPASVTLDVSEGDPSADILIRNCGGAALEWQATPSDAWIRIETEDGQPMYGAYEVAAGRSYRIKVAETASGGLSGNIALSFPGASGGPASIRAETVGTRPEPEPEPQVDAGSGQDAGVVSDAGSAEDGGTTFERDQLNPDTGGCSCGASRSGGIMLLCLLLLGARWSRRLTSP